MSSTNDAIEHAAAIAGELLAEISEWDLPQVDDCGLYCERTAMGQAWNAAIAANTLSNDMNRHDIGSPCELEQE